jgi:hypothetical protein
MAGAFPLFHTPEDVPERAPAVLDATRVVATTT